MCSIALAGLALSALGTIQSFQGQRQQARAAEESAKFNAQVAQNNSIIAQQQAVQAHDVGRVKAAKEGLKARQLIGLQRASSAGQGTRVGVGSAADIEATTRGQAGVDVATIRSNAARESLGFIRQAQGFEQQAGITLAEGSNRASALNSQATSSLLSGASSVATKWGAYRS